MGARTHTIRACRGGAHVRARGLTGWVTPYLKVCEMTLVAPQVVAYRTARIVSGGWPPSTRDVRENTRMVTEKIDACGQMVTAVLAFSSGAGPASSPGPSTRCTGRVKANHRRLSRL